VKLGVFLPTYLLPGGEREHADQIRRFAARAEELGFESLFVTDHLLTATRFYRVSWLEPLTTLAYAAAVTTRPQLGTSILVLPTRQPVVLAKEVATIQRLSGGRFVLGAGVGWYEPEFEAVGGHRTERGRRTDEVLDATMELLTEPDVTFEGRFYGFDGATVEPLGPVPPVWVAGGRQLAHAASPERPVMAPTVLRRICRWNGWIARPTAAPDQIEEDLREIDAELERNGTSRAERGFTVAHENFCWLSEQAGRHDAVAEQRERMFAVVSDERPWDYIEAVYLTGTIDDVQRGVQARIDAGVEYLLLHTMTADLRQLELFAKHVLEPFAGVAPQLSRV
jgi:probable F420-dependent oxidoreductase